MVGLALGGGAIAGLALASSRDRACSVLPAWGALHAAAYLVLRPDVAFERHVYPVALVAAVGVLLALGSALTRAPPIRRRRRVLVGGVGWNAATF